MNRVGNAVALGLMSQEGAQEELNAEKIFLLPLKDDQITSVEEITNMTTELDLPSVPKATRPYRSTGA